MRTTHWKLFPGFLLGLLVMWATCCGVMVLLTATPSLLDVHWGIWLAVTLLFPFLALVAHLKAAHVPVLYLLSYFLNAVGSGFTFGIVMSYLLEEPTGAELLLALGLSMLPALAAMLILCLVYSVFRRDQVTAIVFTILGVVAVFAGLVKLGPGAFFSLLFFLPMPLGCAKSLGKPWNVDRYLSISGFGAYLIVMLAGIMILTEAEPDGLLDALFDGITDVAIDATQSKHQTQNPHP